MRKPIAVLVVLGALVGLPATALAGGSGYESCPAGLVQQSLGVGSPTELTEATTPITIEGTVLVPHSVRDSSDIKPFYNYVWGKYSVGEPDAATLLCGVKLPTGLSESIWVLIAIGSCMVGMALAFIMVLWKNPKRPKAEANWPASKTGEDGHNGY